MMGYATEAFTPPLTRQVTRQEAQELSHLCCSDCWRPIVATFHWNRETKQNEDFISCGTPGCEMHGFVSKRFVEQRTQISYAEYREARHALRDVLPHPINLSEQTLLTQIGVLV